MTRQGVVFGVVLLLAGLAVPSSSANSEDACKAAIEEDIMAWSDVGKISSAEFTEAAIEWTSICGPLGEEQPQPESAEADCDEVLTCLLEGENLCGGSGSTILGWHWHLNAPSLATEPIEIDDALTSGEWEVPKTNNQTMVGNTNGLLGATTFALDKTVIRFGPVPFAAYGSIDPSCFTVPATGLEASDSAKFEATSFLLSHFVTVSGTGRLCAIPC